MDVAEAIDAEAITVTLTSKVSEGYTDGGRAEIVWSAPVSIRAAVQPIGRALMDVDEGKRSEAKWLLWSRTIVQEDDIIQIPRGKMIVLQVWEHDTDGFCRAALGGVK